MSASPSPKAISNRLREKGNGLTLNEGAKSEEKEMMSIPKDVFGRARFHFTGNVTPIILILFFFLVDSANAAPKDSLDAADTLPPPETIFSIYVTDSLSGMPLSEASANIRNSEANYTQTNTNSLGWAHILRSGLPRSLGSQYWVTAGKAGYVSRMITFSGCGSDGPTPCVLRFALIKATEKNSLTYSGTLLDSASRQPIAGFTFDLSHSWLSGWSTYVTQTDDSGHFSFSGIPIEKSSGYLWIRSPPRIDLWFTVNLLQGDETFVIPRILTTSLLSPRRTRLNPATQAKSTPFFIFRSWHGNAVGRSKPRQ